MAERMEAAAKARATERAAFAAYDALPDGDEREAAAEVWLSAKAAAAAVHKATLRKPSKSAEAFAAHMARTGESH